MKEENALVEKKEPKGLFQWLKSKFEQLKEKFSTAKNVEQESQEIPEGEMSLNELDEIKAGIPLEALNNDEQKPWDLTQEQKETVEKGYEEIKNEMSQGEMSLEELDNVKAGQPTIDENESQR